MQKREDSSFPCNSSPTDAHREVIRDLKSLKSHRMGFSCYFFIIKAYIFNTKIINTLNSQIK